MLFVCQLPQKEQDAFIKNVKSYYKKEGIVYTGEMLEELRNEIEEIEFSLYLKIRMLCGISMGRGIHIYVPAIPVAYSLGENLL